MVLENELRDANPWWKSAKQISKDKQIEDWENTTIKHDPRLRHEIGFQKDVVYTLRGPRQVGKTTLVKLQIKDFLENGISPWNIFYYALDLEKTSKDIVEVVNSYLKISKRQRRSDLCYIFLDEASTIPEWQKAIKSLNDGKKLKNCTVFVTGSQALNIKKATERLPGRKGITSETYDKILLPIKFSEFISVTDPELYKLFANELQLLSSERRQKKVKKLLNLEIDEAFDRLHAYQNELEDHLNEYLLTGGTLRIIDERIKRQFIEEGLYKDYLDGFLGDWALAGKDEALLQQFMRKVISTIGSLSSWQNISRDADLGSVNTAIDYAHTLQRLFITTLFFKYDDKRKTPIMRDQKKIHFQDPFYHHMFHGWFSTTPFFDLSEKTIQDKIRKSTLVEGLIGNHLVRWAFAISQKKQTFQATNHVFYWRDEQKREVDYVLYDENDIEVPIEVKYRTPIPKKELGGLYSFQSKVGTKSGIVLSETSLEQKSEYVAIPTSVFLMFV